MPVIHHALFCVNGVKIRGGSHYLINNKKKFDIAAFNYKDVISYLICLLIRDMFSFRVGQQLFDLFNSKVKQNASVLYDVIISTVILLLHCSQL